MPPLVGRDPELATIDRFLRSVPEGYRAVVLRGGAGYGKSALLEETVTRAQTSGFRVLTARPAETEAELAFGVLVELLEPVELSELDLPRPQARALDVALRRLDPDEAHPVDPLGLSLAVIAALRELAVERPLLVALDDVQWCDPPSLRTLGFALRRVDTESVGLAVGLRTGGGSDTEIPGSTAGVVYVDVGPLDEAAFGVAVRRDAGAVLPRPVIRHLHVACDGNPLFGKEVAALLADRRAPDDPAAPVPVPPSAAEAIGRRVGKLGLRTRDVLLAAAALPRPTVEVLLAAFSEEAVDGALAKSAAAAIVAVDGERVRFTHPLVAAAVYGAATPARRRKAHARLARALGSPEERAPHLALAASRPNAAVAAEVEAAAGAASARGALDTAGRLLEQASAVTPVREAAAGRRRLLEAARCHVAAGDTDHARGLLDRLVPLSPPGEELAEVLLELALAGGSYSQRGFGYAYAALEHAQGSPALLLRIHYCLMELHISAGETGLVAGHAQAALEAAEALGDEATIMSARAAVVYWDFVRGEPVGLDTFERAADLERETGTWQGGEGPIADWAQILRRVGQYDRARELVLELLRGAVERGHERDRATILGLLSDVESDAGNLLLARKYALEQVELGEQQDERTVRMYGLFQGGTVLALLGDPDEAEALARAGQELALSPVLEPWLAWGDHALGLAALERGEAAAALEHFDRSGRRYDAAGWVDPAFRHSPTDIEALIALGRLDEADARVAEYEARCSPELHARGLAHTARCRGLIASLRGDHEEAEAEFARSLYLQELAPSPYERARTLMALGTARRRHRRRGDARQALEEAVELFERSGAVVWADRARADIAALGLKRGPADELTPMEDRVARAVAEGATNRQAAASLFLSERTIEYHLRNVYRKLGLRSRSELAPVLAARTADTLPTAAV